MSHDVWQINCVAAWLALMMTRQSVLQWCLACEGICLGGIAVTHSREFVINSVRLDSMHDKQEASIFTVTASQIRSQQEFGVDFAVILLTFCLLTLQRPHISMVSSHQYLLSFIACQ